MRLLGLLSVTGLASLAGAAHAMSLEAQQAAAHAAAFAAPTPAAASSSLTLAPLPFVQNASEGPSLSWLSLGAAPGIGANDRVILSTFSERVTAGAVFGPQSFENLEPVSYDFAYRRSWPSALSLAAGRYDIDLTPHAGLGAGDGGGSAQAGAMVRFGRNLGDKVAQRLGARDAASFNGQPRWYLYAASSGTAMGLNLLRREGDWRRAGVSEDSASALIGDTQAGFGWRRGSMAAALGYVHREVKIRQGLEGLMGAGDRKDDLVSLSFTIKQH